MGTTASQITSLTIVYSTVYSDADQRKHQSSASLAFVRGIHRGIPRTNGQQRGKSFHLMTSSWKQTGWSFHSFDLLSLLWRHNERDGVESHASRLFAQPFVQAPMKENIKAPRHWSLWGEFTGDRLIPRTPVTGGFPLQRTRNAEKVFIWWRHHVLSNIGGIAWIH